MIKPHELGPFDWQPYDPSWRQRLKRRQAISRIVFGTMAALLAIGLVTLPMWVFLL